MQKWIILFLLLIALIFFLPQLASTSLGKPFFVRILEKRTYGRIDIGSMRFSWFGPQTFRQVQWTRNNFTGTVEELQIDAPFWSFSGPFHLKNGTVSSRDGKTERIEGEIEGDGFQLTGTLKNLPLDPQLTPILGPTLDLVGTIQLKPGQKTIDLTLSSANLQTKLSGFLTEHAITLREPLTATLRLTPALSTLLLKDANPLFLTGVASKNPVTLQIEPKDFLFPLPFSLERLIAAGVLDMGQVQCQNGKSLAALISLLKATPLLDAKQMNVWFTPISFRIEGGQVQTERMDALLADSIHICTWGRIDLIRDQIHMFLGLPADTLQKSFGIQNLSPNYVLKIPIRGSTKEPDIATGPAAAKIGALIAAGNVPKKGWLGGIANLFSNPKEDADVPPAKRPFPWE